MFAAFGADMVQLEFADLYGALEKRTAQGQENPLALILAAKLHEVQTFCSLTNHMWDGNWLLANGDLWKGMPSSIREVIEHEFDRSYQDEREDLAQLNPHLRGDLAELGLTINNVEHQHFRDVLRTAGFYTEWRGKFGETAWRLLEDSVGALS